MEERKRPASNDNDNSGPPLKRQATAVNGAGRTHPDADMPWQDDLEVSLVQPDEFRKLKCSWSSPCNIDV